MSKIIARIAPAKVSVVFADPIAREFVERDPYTGSYTVTPSDEAQTLQTNGLRMTGNVTVEAIVKPTATKEISITENGETTEDVLDYANAHIAVNVPQPSGTKNISIAENGTTTHDVEDFVSAAITVAVPQPSGTKQISISANGTTTWDVNNYENAEIAVAVPVPTLTSVTLTQNGTFTPASGTAYNSVTVAIPSANGVSF